MKILSDGKGKFVLDFEGLEIDSTEKEATKKLCISDLFNSNNVSEIKNAIWKFSSSQNWYYLEVKIQNQDRRHKVRK